MNCAHCNAPRRFLHRLVGGPGVYVCCRCYGCSDEEAREHQRR